MRPLRLTAGLLGVLAMFASLDRLLPEGPFVMTGNAKADQGSKVPHNSSMPPARDPSVAVAEEYEIARRKGTAEALELFIARHGDDPLAEKARADLRKLSR